MKDVEQEPAAQVEKAMAHRVGIDKLDTHLHVHPLPGIFHVVQAIARQYGIKALHLSRECMMGRGITLGSKFIATSRPQLSCCPQGSPDCSNRSPSL